MPEGFNIHDYGIGAVDGNTTFYPPLKDGFVSHSIRRHTQDSVSRGIEVPLRSLTSICAELGHDRVDVLKMDIEGAEYEVVNSIANSAIPIGQLLVEFHHGMYDISVQETRAAMQHLIKFGFRVFHVSDVGREYSLIHTSLLRGS